MQLVEMVKPLLEYYQNDPISFVYVDKNAEPLIHEQFGEKQYHIVAYRPKRSRYIGYKDADYSQQSIRSFIDDILGGGGRPQKVEESDLRFNTDNRKNDL